MIMLIPRPCVTHLLLCSSSSAILQAPRCQAALRITGGFEAQTWSDLAVLLKHSDPAAAATAFINSMKVLDAEEVRGRPVEGDAGECLGAARMYRASRGGAPMQAPFGLTVSTSRSK
jgi:hypothetical protein